MRFKKYVAVSLFVLPMLMSAAPAALAASRDDVINAYTSAQQRADRAYSKAWRPNYDAEQSALKAVDEKETKAIWAARGGLKNTASGPADAVKQAREKAFAARIAAESEADAKYAETIKKARATGLAEMASAQERFQSAQNLVDELNKTLANGPSTPENATVDTALTAANAALQAAKAALEQEQRRINGVFASAYREAETARYQAKWNAQHLADIATKPEEDMLAIAKEADQKADSAALKPVTPPFKKESDRIKADYEKAEAQLRKPHQAAFLQRVRIWSQYDSGKISAETAVRELNALSIQTQE